MSSKTEDNISFNSVKETLESAFGQLKLLENGQENKYEGRAMTKTLIAPTLRHVEFMACIILYNIQLLVSLDKGQLKEKDACISKLKEEIQLKEYDRNVYHQQMQSEAKQNLKLKTENEDLQKQIEKLKKENEELKKKPEVLTLPRNDNRADAQMPTTKNIEGQMVSVGDRVFQKNAPVSLPTAPIQPPTDQRTLADKSLNQIKEFYLERDRSPEISEPMIVSDDSESDDENEQSDLQFVPNQSKLSNKQIYKRRSTAKKNKAKTEVSKVGFRKEIVESELLYFIESSI